MKVLCVGRNYVEHIKELENQIPKDIVFFLKPDTSITKSTEDFYLPDFSSNVQYECEVVVKIDKVGKCIPSAFAKNYYSSVALGIDYTLRDLQQKAKEKSLPWTLCKGFDYSAPISRFISIEEVGGNVQNIDFSLKKNGAVVQKANTNQMLHSIDEIISYISQFITLKIGDIIFTGTPSGVGKVEIGDRLKGFIGTRLLIDQKIK